MRKMFTKLFGLTLLMLLFGVPKVKAQFLPSTGDLPLGLSNIELVTPLSDVCDSMNLVDFKVVGFGSDAQFSYNYDGTGTFPGDSTFALKEGTEVKIQVVVNGTTDTMISNLFTFQSNLVDSIKIMESDVESPKCGGEQGSIKVNFDGGYVSTKFGAPEDAYRYLYISQAVWDANGQESGDYTGLAVKSTTASLVPGTYYVAAFDYRGGDDPCLVDLNNIAAWDTAIIGPASPVVMVDTIYGADPVCFNGTTDVYVNVSGGTAASYGLVVDLVDAADDAVVATDSTLTGTAMFADIVAGSYYAVVTDSLGCDDTSDSTLVLEAPAAVEFDIAIKSVDCFGGANGEITVVIDTAVSAAANTYDAKIVSLDTDVDNTPYTWQTMGPNDSITFTGLSPIYYALFVRDATNGCDSVPYENPNESLNYISLQSPGEISLDLTYNDSIVCYGDSTDITINNILGGSGDFSVELVPTFGGSAITPIADSVWRVDGGSYTIKVTDNGSSTSCPLDSTIYIHENGRVNIDGIETVDPMCPGQSDGLITITDVYGGTGMYEYAIFDTTKVEELNLEQYTTLEDSLNSLSWKNNNVFNVAAGVYAVYVRDRGCQTNFDVSLVEIDKVANDIEVDYDYTDTLICNGAGTATIEVDLVSWSRRNTFPSPEFVRNIRAYYTTDPSSVYVSGTELERTNGFPNVEWTAEDLTAGTYYIWAVDTMGCELDTNADGTRDYITLEIKEYDELFLDVEVVDSASCAGTNDGTIRLTMAGGDTTSWYFADSYYNWNGGMLPPMSVIEKSASIKDISGSCELGSFRYGIAGTYQQALLMSPNSMNCWPVVGVNNYKDSQLEKSATAVSGYYAEEVFINVTPGTHYVVLYDLACGQRVVEEIEVFGYEAVTLGAVDSITNIVCYGEAAGEIFIDAATGGSGELLYTLYEGGKTMADTVAGYVNVTDTAFVGLPAGMYYIQAKDFGPSVCAGDWSDMIEITQPGLDFSIEAYDITCNGNADGLVVLSMKGAGDNAPLFKLGASSWQKFDELVGDTVWTKNVNILYEGDYVVSAIDSLGHLAGCDGMEIPFTIVEPPVLTVNAAGMDTTACSIADDGYITVSIEGGKVSVDSFEVELVGVETALIQRDSVLVFEGLAEGGYELVVTEVKAGLEAACVMTDSVWVIPPDAIEADIDYTQMLACKGDSTGYIELDITGGAGVYEIELNGVNVELDADNRITGLPEGEYEIVISDSIKIYDAVCQLIDTVVIGEPDEYLTLDATKIQDVSCQDSGMFSIQASGGTPGYHYYAALSTFPEHALLPDPTSAEWQSDSIFTVGDPGTWVVWVMDDAGCIVGGEFDANDQEINEWRIPILEPAVKVTVEATSTNPSCNGDVAMVVVENVVVTEENATVDRDYTVWFESLEGDTLAVNDTLQTTITDTTWVIAFVMDDESGCTGSDTVMLTQPDVLSAEALVVAEGEFTCPDAVEGYLEAMVSGGTKPYKYQVWVNGHVKTPNYLTNYSFLAKVDSTYSFVVMDAKGCTDTLDVPVLVESADPIEFTIIRETTCASDSAASVEIEITGEEGRMFQVIWTQIEDTNGSVEYTDSSAWFPAGVNELDRVFLFDNENIADKHYEVTVVDNMGCTGDTISVTYDDKTDDPVELTATVGVENECTTDVTISAAGGAGTYTYMINGVVVDAGLQALAGGTHVIYVEDKNGCWDTDTVTVDYSEVMYDSISYYAGDTAHYTANGLDTMLLAGDYEYEITAEGGCVSLLMLNVEELPLVVPTVVSVTPTDTIADNHADITMVFDGPITFNDSVTGSLYITQVDSTEATIEIPITSDMVSGNTITVDYDYMVVGALELNTTYVVTVDSGVVVGGLTWGGDVAGDLGEDWMFTTGPDHATGIETPVQGVEFKVYPNPFNSFIRIDNSEKLDRVIISNIAGQRVLDIENPTYEIRTGNLVTGVYVVTLISNDEIVKSERIIKR